ncbi:MSMEG_0570 family nitrogen starvation response protein [uncultured Pseudomonas sp.]|uniref:MSMEG_0570 family nitrogen starvation response protein n=1 Tax=uncultured Pseudomonas sp. TaxID=114707 RepID=UPI0025DEDCF2|nr:MSMEG_0570 family nitrogen starvation response protein [uncultured Pseudomonas sp.]
MPAVIIRLRWPDGQESTAYSPSTSIGRHLESGRRYPLSEFLQRAESGLHAASERVKEVKGFYCSSAMDSLSELRRQARAYADGDDLQVEVLELQQQGRTTGNPAACGDI